MSGLPTGTVTFLFTDIEGSTRLLEASPEAYRAALARHDDTIRRAVAAHCGVVFQTRGDGFCAAFASPAAAIRAACEAQRSLADEPSRDGVRLSARMGLHTGEVECHDGEYFGTPLHRCARIMDSAHGGQVVLSGATVALVAGGLPDDLWLHDLGEYRLRDLDRPERIHQLCAPGLPASFPALRTQTAAPNTLPPQSTAFVGREAQMQAVRALLLRPDTRLVTLTGPGGTGKTRLAIQVARTLLDTLGTGSERAFPDGVVFVPLAPIADPDLVPLTIAQALDIREVPGRTVVAALRDALQSKHVLLVLDNFEQVIDAASHVAALLAAAPRLKILVTSRAVLRLYGEREYPVPPLALPDRRANPSASHLAQFEAVHLFVERAQAARPEFALTDGNAADVAEVCHRLDGLPLALELAAARTRALPPGQLLQRMERRLPLLTGGARDLPARQRTLRDAIGWSYDLLDPDEQTLFRRLAVFRGCSLEAVEAVCPGEPVRLGTASVALPLLHIDVLDGLQSLVEKSLIRQETGVDGAARYRMLETVREYALEQLAASGESDTVHRRHALSAVQFAEEAESKLHGTEQGHWFAQVSQEHDNLRAALRWCEERGYAEPSYRLCDALWWFWSVRGHTGEGRERLANVLARFPVAASSRRVGLRARALLGASLLASFQGDYASARTLGEEGLALRRAAGDAEGIFHAIEGLTTATWLQGDYVAARRYAEEGLALATTIGDRRGYLMLLNTLGNISHDAGDLDVARNYFDRCHPELSDEFGIHGPLISMSQVALEQGDLNEAEHLADGLLAKARRDGLRHLEPLALATLGGIALERGDRPAALGHLTACITISHELGDTATVSQVLERFVELAVPQGDFVRALTLAGASEALRERAGAQRSRNGQSRLERFLEPARQSLGVERAREAWLAGRALHLDDAVATALRAAEPPAILREQHGSADAGARPATGATADLTRREREVALLIARGLSNRQIAETLVITEGTAANHVNHILGKLGVGTRAQVAVWVAQRSLV